MKSYSQFPQSAVVSDPHLDCMTPFFAERLEQIEGKLNFMHEATRRRVYENAIIAAAESTGQPVAVVWSGMDCDCCQYSGVVSLVSTDPESPWGSDNNGNPFPNLRAAVTHHIDKTYAYADGPCYYTLMLLDDAATIRETHRDLALEAFEDGHPHVVYA